MASPSEDQCKALRGFTRLTAVFNWSVIALVVECYAMVMPTPLLLMCWSLLVIEAVTENSIRPYWKWASSSSLPPANSDPRCDIAIAGAVFLKVGISIVLVFLVVYEAKWQERQNIMLFLVGCLVVFLEGFPQTLVVSNEFEKLMKDPLRKIMEIKEYIREGQVWETVSFLAPSVSNAMICVTGIIVLGGSLGNMLSEKTYWIFVAIVVVDVIGEAIHRFGCGNRSISELKADSIFIHVAILVRMVVLGFLCYWLLEQIFQKSYLDSNMEATSCDLACKERSEVILMATVVLGGFEAAGIITTLFSPSWSHYVPCTVFYTILLIAYLLFFLSWPIPKFFQILHTFVKNYIF